MSANDFPRRAFVVHLTRRPDRIDRFRTRWNAAFQTTNFRDVPTFERFEAFDGSRLDAPKRWTSTRGAFGCFWSHLTLWARELSRGVGDDEPIAIFEDDAVFCDRFAEKFAALRAALPNGVELLYLGGEHLTRGRPAPTPIAPGLVRVVNCNRLHAYVATGRALRTLFARCADAIDAPSGTWENQLDYEVGQATERGDVVAVAASPFLVGQDAGPSDITGVVRDAETFFDGKGAR